jgi:hypothetical protein
MGVLLPQEEWVTTAKYRKPDDALVGIPFFHQTVSYYGEEFK